MTPHPAEMAEKNSESARYVVINVAAAARARQNHNCWQAFPRRKIQISHRKRQILMEIINE
jgi:hypothetical protein